MEKLTTIWNVIEKNRWTTIMPFCSIIAWIVLSIGCEITTLSPTRDGVKVSVAQLQQDYDTWVSDCNATAKRFESAAADIETQQDERAKISEILMAVASGNVTNYTGLLSMITTAGLFGVGADNVRKNGVIAGLKRNKKPK